MNKLLNLLLILIIPGIFLLFIVLLEGVIFLASFIGLLFLSINLVWNLLPSKARISFQCSRWKFVRIILSCSILFFFLGETINYYWLPDKNHPLSVVINTLIFVFAILTGWSLAKRERRRILIIGSAVFVLLIPLLTVVAASDTSSAARQSLEQIRSLPYLSWVSAENSREKSGVVLNRHDPAYQALHVYTDDGFPDAYLMDISGKILHTWSDNKSLWSHVEMLGNGDLLAIVQNHNLSRLDWNSDLKWINRIRAHHDIDIDENGNIITLVSRNELVVREGSPLPIINDYICILSPEGEVISRYSLYDIIQAELSPDLSGRVLRWWLKKFYPPVKGAATIRKNLSKLIGKRGSAHNYYDVFHTNTLKIIDRDIKGIAGKGDFLICFRQLNMVGIIDIKQKRLVWKWGPGILDLPHNPTLLKNGNILIFDNGWRRTYSRIIELNPRTEQIVWSYESQPREQFHSKLRGSCQRLPDGNTLVTDSEKGRVFEISPEGLIVWEFYNPKTDNEFQKRKAIYRMTRIINPGNYPILDAFVNPSETRRFPGRITDAE